MYKIWSACWVESLLKKIESLLNNQISNNEEIIVFLTHMKQSYA